MEREPGGPALYVVATPIGNLGDLTFRALETLKSVDVLVAEDTRVTAKLCAHFGLGKPLLRFDAHAGERACERLVGLLAEGKSVALVTDAGTPGVSDPGAVAVNAVRDAGFAVVPVPGASAAAAAWSVAGISAPGFVFAGFLPARAGERRRALASLAPLPFALVFYEAPHRVLDTARALVEALGETRDVLVARELTKRHEEIARMPLAALPAWIEADANRQRGEFVLVVESGGPAATDAAQAGAGAVLDALLSELPPAQAARLAARITGASRDALYALALARRGRGGTDSGESRGERPDGPE